MSQPLSIRRFSARARAKVNLSLEVLRKRRDGYHEIESIMQSVDLYDELDIEFDRTAAVSIIASDPDIPCDASNTCHRAVEALRPFLGSDLGATIRIAKNIPHSSGLGGASADAAAVILAANEAAGRKLPVATLETIAARVGSDVPFMLRGGTMLASGRGEIVTPLTPLGGGIFLIVKPTVDISTASVYQDVNLTLTRRRYRINLKAVNTVLGRFPDVALTFRNALEDVVCPSYPLVSEVLGDLLASKPRFASMSGSGSALFAVYRHTDKASEIAERFAVRGFFTAVVEPSLRAVDVYPECG